MNKKRVDLTLYAILDTATVGRRNIKGITRSLVKGGATIIQLREPKDMPAEEFLRDAIRVKEAIGPSKVLFIINDRADIALACGADGVHLGLQDLPIPVARRILGKGKVIGASVYTLSQAKEKEKEGADYLGVGAVFATPTKPDAERVSLATLKRIKESVRIPVIAIGGINRENVERVLETGVDGIAVASAILKADGIERATREMREIIRAKGRS